MHTVSPSIGRPSGNSIVILSPLLGGIGLLKPIVGLLKCPTSARNKSQGEFQVGQVILLEDKLMKFDVISREALSVGTLEHVAFKPVLL